MDMATETASKLVNLDLKQQNEDASRKSLKHKHKSKRPQHRSLEKSMSSSHHRMPHPEHIRELVAGKIAQIEVGDENDLDTPIDLSGIYQDDTLARSICDAFSALTHRMLAEAVDEDGTSSSKSLDQFSQELMSLAKKNTENISLLQRKIGQVYSRYVLMKQRESAVKAELSKVNMAKSRLEQLCRELQKQNKLIINESRRIADEEDQKRKNLLAQFQKSIEEVGAKMDEQGKDYVASLKENEKLQQKLKTFLDQYTAREEHFNRQLEAKDLQIQLAEAKLQRQIELTAQETEKSTTTLLRAKIISDREAQLQVQLNSYNEKFSAVQETLVKSNDMFTSFRSEMDKMSARTKKLEKENASLRKKCAEYDQGAIASIQENMMAKEASNKLQDKVKMLESLCRQLQTELKSARNGT